MVRSLADRTLQPRSATPAATRDAVHGLRRLRDGHAAAGAHLRDDGAVVREQALAEHAHLCFF